MQTIAPEGLETSLTSDGTVTEIVESFTEAVDAPESAVSPFIELVEEMADALNQSREEARQARNRAREAEAKVDELETQVESNSADIEEQAKADAQDRQRLTEVEDAVDELEDDLSGHADPTPQAEKTAQMEPLTPIERLSEGDREDIAQQVTPSIKRAVALFENLPDWGTSTLKGTTLRPADRPKELLEAATGESLAWQQYYRAAEALESLSKGAVTFIDHRRHGKTVVFHDETDVYSRAMETSTGDSRTSLAAD
jgi:hypothetical protein